MCACGAARKCKLEESVIHDKGDIGRVYFLTIYVELCCAPGGGGAPLNAYDETSKTGRKGL